MKWDGWKNWLKIGSNKSTRFNRDSKWREESKVLTVGTGIENTENMHRRQSFENSGENAHASYVMHHIVFKISLAYQH